VCRNVVLPHGVRGHGVLEARGLLTFWAAILSVPALHVSAIYIAVVNDRFVTKVLGSLMCHSVWLGYMRAYSVLVLGGEVVHVPSHGCSVLSEHALAVDNVPVLHRHVCMLGSWWE